MQKAAYLNCQRGQVYEARNCRIVAYFERGLGLKGLRIANLKFVLPPPSSQSEGGEPPGESICWPSYAEPPPPPPPPTPPPDDDKSVNIVAQAIPQSSAALATFPPPPPCTDSWTWWLEAQELLRQLEAASAASARPPLLLHLHVLAIGHRAMRCNKLLDSLVNPATVDRRQRLRPLRPASVQGGVRFVGRAAAARTGPAPPGTQERWCRQRQQGRASGQASAPAPR